MDTIQYLKLTISRKKGCKVTARLLIQLAKCLKLNEEKESIEGLEKKLGQAYDRFKELKKSHKKLRHTFLEDLANAMESAGKGKKASNLRNLTQIEDQREMYRKLCYITKKAANLGTTFVTTIDENGNKRDITEKTILRDPSLKRIEASTTKLKKHALSSDLPYLMILETTGKVTQLKQY